MNFAKLFSKMLAKPWQKSDVEQYVGDLHSSYLSYASDSQIRSLAASGGTVSALLIRALDKGEIDGAVVLKTEIRDGKVRNKFLIAKNRVEVLASRGSKYSSTNFQSEVFPLIREFKGRLAIVGLPCDLSSLKRICAKEPSLKDKISFTIALVCGHISQNELIDTVTEKLTLEARAKNSKKSSGSNDKPVTQEELIDYKFRLGHWRGHIQATFNQGTTIEKHSSYYNQYQNLFFFSERKCLNCFDHFGYDADLSLGDVWHFALKDEPVKHTGVVVKNDTGLKIWEDAVLSGTVISEEKPIEFILDGQARILPAHYNVNARHRAGKILNISIPSNKVDVRVKWHDFLAAFFLLLNWKWSQSKRFKRLIFLVPKPILKFYLYIIKGLESL